MDILRQFIQEDTTIPPKISGKDLIYLLLILLLAGKQLYGFQHALDIPFFDETEYLQKGVGLLGKSFNDWGPSYNLWYFIVSQCTSGPVETFYLNYALLMLALPALLYLFLIHYRWHKTFALLAAGSFALQPLLIANFTYVSHFCLLLILLAFIAIARTRSAEGKVVIALTAAYSCMYARQEFLLVVVTLFVVWLAVIWKQRRITLHISYLLLLGVVVLLWAIFGFISFRAQGIDRSLFAFLQHFYTNYIFWTKKVLTKDEFDALDIFHGSKTMFQCLLANPELFLKHMGTNIINYGLNMFKYVENFLLPAPVFHFLGKGKHLLFIALLGYVFYRMYTSKTTNGLIQYCREQPLNALILACFFGWSFFAIVFIFPERHYIIVQFAWWIWLFGMLAGNHLQFLQRSVVFYPFLILLFMLAPRADKVDYYHNLVIDKKLQPNLQTIRYLTKHNSGKPTVLFTTERGFDAYLPDNYRELFLEQDDVRPYIKNGDIDIASFFRDKEVDIIFMNEKLQSLVRQTLKDKATILLNEPEKMGFRKQSIHKKLNAYLLIKI